MGLSLHVHVHAPASLDEPAVRAIVARWHAVAEAFASEGRVDRVFELSNETADLSQFATAWLSLPHFLACCKTQYASLHGWESFRRCHLAAVDLALAGQSLGLDVRIEDEGGYWPGRNEVALRAAVERLNRLVAGLAGALKDVEDASGRAPSVESPVFEHPAFERLEAEAQDTADSHKLRDAFDVLRKAARLNESD